MSSTASTSGFNAEPVLQEDFNRDPCGGLGRWLPSPAAQVCPSLWLHASFPSPFQANVPLAQVWRECPLADGGWAESSGPELRVGGCRVALAGMLHSTARPPPAVPRSSGSAHSQHRCSSQGGGTAPPGCGRPGSCRDREGTAINLGGRREGQECLARCHHSHSQSLCSQLQSQERNPWKVPKSQTLDSSGSPL